MKLDCGESHLTSRCLHIGGQIFNASVALFVFSVPEISPAGSGKVKVSISSLILALVHDNKLRPLRRNVEYK